MKIIENHYSSIYFISFWLYSAAISSVTKKIVFYLVLIPILSITLLSCRAKTSEDEFKIIQNVIDVKLSKWKEFSLEKDARFDLKSFKLHSTRALNPEQKYHYTKERANILDSIYYFCYSPDRAKYVDIYSSHAELDSVNGSIEALFSPDSDAHLVDLLKRKILIILSLGTGASLDDIAWIDNNSFVIVGYGYLEPVNNNAPLICNPYIYYINLEDKTLKTYMSTRSIDRLPGYYNYKFPEFVKYNN